MALVAGLANMQAIEIMLAIYVIFNPLMSSDPSV